MRTYTTSSPASHRMTPWNVSKGWACASSRPLPASSGRASLPSVSGGGLHEGATLDYEIELKAGEYVYSCPLNSTPDYRLVVKG